MSRKPRFIAGGRSNIARENLERIEREVNERHAAALAAAGPPRRLWIKWRIRREIREELDKIAPSGGLYARTGVSEEVASGE